MNTVITGSATGIGAALARAIAQRGGSVILADIDLATAEAGAEAIRASGGKAEAIFADHADEDSLARLADYCFEALGTIDLVFANAGVGAGGPLYSTPQRNVDWVLAVNLIGPLWLSRAFVPRMIAQAIPSRFVVTGSEHSLGLPSRGGQASIYTLSKHAVLGLAETLRRDLAETPVDVAIICPAVVTTEIWNPLRTRHERFGGARIVERRPPPSAGGITPDVAAERILEGIDAGEFYVFTHGADLAEVHNARADEVSGALARFAERHGNAE